MLNVREFLKILPQIMPKEAPEEFSHSDFDKNRKIDQQEFIRAIKETDPKVKESQVKKFFDKVDGSLGEKDNQGSYQGMVYSFTYLSIFYQYSRSESIDH